MQPNIYNPLRLLIEELGEKHSVKSEMEWDTSPYTTWIESMVSSLQKYMADRDVAGLKTYANGLRKEARNRHDKSVARRKANDFPEDQIQLEKTDIMRSTARTIIRIIAAAEG